MFVPRAVGTGADAGNSVWMVEIAASVLPDLPTPAGHATLAGEWGLTAHQGCGVSSVGLGLREPSRGARPGRWSLSQTSAPEATRTPNLLTRGPHLSPCPSGCFRGPCLRPPAAASSRRRHRLRQPRRQGMDSDRKASAGSVCPTRPNPEPEGPHTALHDGGEATMTVQPTSALSPAV